MNFTFPVKIKFLNPEIEAINQGLGGRMFDFLNLIKSKFCELVTAKQGIIPLSQVK